MPSIVRHCALSVVSLALTQILLNRPSTISSLSTGVRFSWSLMPATILDGTKIASDIRKEVAAEVKAIAAAGMRPGLAVVLVGHNPASEVYVRGKVKACEEVGIYSETLTPPDSVTTDELLSLVENLNRRDDIDGILVQLPLPSRVYAKKVLMTLVPAK